MDLLNQYWWLLPLMPLMRLDYVKLSCSRPSERISSKRSQASSSCPTLTSPSMSEFYVTLEGAMSSERMSR